MIHYPFVVGPSDRGVDIQMGEKGSARIGAFVDIREVRRAIDPIKRLAIDGHNITRVIAAGENLRAEADRSPGCYIYI